LAITGAVIAAGSCSGGGGGGIEFSTGGGGGGGGGAIFLVDWASNWVQKIPVTACRMIFFINKI